MKRISLVFGIILAGCSGNPPNSRQPKVSDADVAEIASSNPGMTRRCLDQIRFGGIEAAPAQASDCFEMSAPRRWRGLWRDDFEGSRFCPAPAKECSAATGGDEIWLDFNSSLPAEYKRTRFGGLYEVDFIGRGTVVKGHYGHMGVSSQEVVVDRMISMRPVKESKKE